MSTDRTSRSVVTVAAFAVALFIAAIGVAYAAPTINVGDTPPNGHYADTQCTDCHGAKTVGSPPPTWHYKDVCTSCHTVNGLSAMSIAALPTAIAYGGSVALSGALSASGTPLTGRGDVKVMRRLGTTGVWTADGLSSWDATSNVYRASRKAYKNTTFKLSFPGDATYTPADSVSRYVGVRCYMPKPVAPLVARRNVYFTVYGYRKPRVAGYTPLLVYRKVGTRWVYVTTRSARNLLQATQSKYVGTVRVTLAGYYRIQAKGVASGNVTTLSTPAYVRVR